MALLTLKFLTDIKDSQYAIVEFHGELDVSTLPQAEKQIAELLGTFSRPHLIFDWQNLKYINSDGIGYVVTVHAKLSKKNMALSIARPQPQVFDICNAIGLPEIIRMFKTLPEAISKTKNEK